MVPFHLLVYVVVATPYVKGMPGQRFCIPNKACAIATPPYAPRKKASTTASLPMEAASSSPSMETGPPLIRIRTNM